MIVTIELKSSVEAEEVAKLQETVLMTFPNQIDKIQKFFMCCGAYGESGYIVWKNFGEVPESCCLRPEINCSKNIFNDSKCEITHRVSRSTLVEFRTQTQCSFFCSRS